MFMRGRSGRDYFMPTPHAVSCEPCDPERETVEAFHKALADLQRGYDQLIVRYGSLSAALTAIATMLDVNGVNVQEGDRPDVVRHLLEASDLLRRPLS